MIQVEELRKSYGDLVAVDGISFAAAAGEIYGFLGPNGAGKSTTIGCISGLLRLGGGRIRIQGKDAVREAQEAKRSLGLVPQELALYEDLSAEDNLRFWGQAYGMRRVELADRVPELLERVGLLDRRREPPKRFSGGMKRRLNLACGLVHRPRLLLLDEPTAGVDPQSRVKLLELVREEAAAGTCVLYTTHYMDEAQALCDRLAIIDHGKLIAEGTLAELRERIGERDLLRLSGSFEPERVRPAAAELPGTELVSVTEDHLVLAMADGSQNLPRIFGALEAAGATVRETTLTQPSLESLFIKLTGRELRS